MKKWRVNRKREWERIYRLRRESSRERINKIVCWLLFVRIVYLSNTYWHWLSCKVNNRQWSSTLLAVDWIRIVITMTIDIFLHRTRTLNPSPSSLQASQVPSTAVSNYAVPNVFSDHLLSSSTVNKLYQIIGGSTARNQTISYQQLIEIIGPLDSNILEIGQNVLLSSKENINFIHEIFRQVRRYFHRHVHMSMYNMYRFSFLSRVILCPVRMV
jgi:hypothetical protein